MLTATQSGRSKKINIRHVPGAGQPTLVNAETHGQRRGRLIGKKPSFSSTCELHGLENQKLGFLRPEILSRYSGNA